MKQVISHINTTPLFPVSKLCDEAGIVAVKEVFNDESVAWNVRLGNGTVEIGCFSEAQARNLVRDIALAIQKNAL